MGHLLGRIPGAGRDPAPGRRRREGRGPGAMLRWRRRLWRRAPAGPRAQRATPRGEWSPKLLVVGLLLAGLAWERRRERSGHRPPAGTGPAGDPGNAARSGAARAGSGAAPAGTSAASPTGAGPAGNAALSRAASAGSGAAPGGNVARPGATAPKGLAPAAGTSAARPTGAGHAGPRPAPGGNVARPAPTAPRGLAPAGGAVRPAEAPGASRPGAAPGGLAGSAAGSDRGARRGLRRRRGERASGGSRARSPVRTTLRLLPGVNRPLTALLAGGVVVAALLPAGFALASGRLVGAIEEAGGQGLGSPAGRRVMVAGVVAVALFAGRQVAAPALRALAEAVGRRLDSHIRARVMVATLAPAGIAHLEDPDVLDEVAAAQAVGTGEITGKEAIAGITGSASRILAGLASAVVLAAYHWALALALVVVYIVMTRALTGDLRRTVNALRGHARRFRRSGYLRDLALAPEAAKEIRVFGLMSWVRDRYRDQWGEAMAAFFTERRRGRWLPPTAALLLAVTQGGTYALLGRAAARGEITVGQLTTYATAAAGVAAIFRIGIDDLNITYGTAPVPAALELEATSRRPRFHLGGALPAEGLPRQGITFSGVSFAYPGSSRVVYSGLDLHIPAGRSLAIVGSNGAGKTTLVKLLARLYDPTGGRIVVDGIDLAELDPRSWQRRIAAIFQDFVHYPLTLGENVTLGAVHGTDPGEARRRAAEQAGLAPLVDRLPGGWDTPLSAEDPGGVDLSGGQWQRVALARALFALEAGAGVLVLDEPTAALDVRAEAAFYDRFLELTAGVTTVVISHRFSTVRRADRIVVVEGGLVVEQGSHHELLATGGHYARMFRLQAEHFVTAEVGGRA